MATIRVTEIPAAELGVNQIVLLEGNVYGYTYKEGRKIFALYDRFIYNNLEANKSFHLNFYDENNNLIGSTNPEQIAKGIIKLTDSFIMNYCKCRTYGARITGLRKLKGL